MENVYSETHELPFKYTEILKKFVLGVTPRMSIVEVYLNQVVLPCGTLHVHTLKTLQKESVIRLGYNSSENWSEGLWKRVMWHDVVLWLMLIDLKEKVDYNPSHDELNLMKEIYNVCTEIDDERFKVMYGMLNISGE